jgi:hypothetical protein
MAEILGINPEDATWEDLRALSRRDAMRLFYTAPAPALESLRGEYEGKMPSGGILDALGSWMVDHLLPTGRLTPGTRWLGMAFEPCEMDESLGHIVDEGMGYIVYLDPRTGEAARGIQALTWVGPTSIGSGSGASLYLDYGALNRGVFRFLHDEVRRVNDGLFICAGCLSLGEALRVPLPFFLSTGSSLES